MKIVAGADALACEEELEIVSGTNTSANKMIATKPHLASPLTFRVVRGITDAEVL
jgi:hypothetical protein